MISAYIDYTTITLSRLLAASAGHFWWPEKSENLENLDLENLNHLQNLGRFFLTAHCISFLTMLLKCLFLSHLCNFWPKETFIKLHKS